MSENHKLYVSVDLEYTDGNFMDGAPLQVGMVTRMPDGEISIFNGRCRLRESALVNTWVVENLSDLLLSCHTGGSTNLGASVVRWLETLRKEASKQHECAPADVLLVFVGWCGAGDWAHLTRLIYEAHPAYMDEVNPFHYGTVEIASLAVGVFGEDWLNATQLAERLGIEGPDESQRHDALYDATWQLALFEALMERIAVGKELPEEQPKQRVNPGAGLPEPEGWSVPDEPGWERSEARAWGWKREAGGLRFFIRQHDGRWLLEYQLVGTADPSQWRLYGGDAGFWSVGEAVEASKAVASAVLPTVYPFNAPRQLGFARQMHKHFGADELGQFPHCISSEPYPDGVELDDKGNIIKSWGGGAECYCYFCYALASKLGKNPHEECPVRLRLEMTP